MRYFLKTLWVIFIAVLVFLESAIICFGAEYASADIRASYQMDKDPGNCTIRHVFVLNALKGAPLPEDAEGSNKRVTVRSSGEFSFGKIIFTRPGRYEYTVSRVPEKNDNILEDRSTYLVTIDVLSDGTVTMVYNKEGDSGKPDEISYIGSYKESVKPEPKPPEHPPVKTGDDTKLYKYILLLLMTLGSLALCHFLIKKKIV